MIRVLPPDFSVLNVCLLLKTNLKRVLKDLNITKWSITYVCQHCISPAVASFQFPASRDVQTRAWRWRRAPDCPVAMVRLSNVTWLHRDNVNVISRIEFVIYVVYFFFTRKKTTRVIYCDLFDRQHFSLQITISLHLWTWNLRICITCSAYKVHKIKRQYNKYTWYTYTKYTMT